MQNYTEQAKKNNIELISIGKCQFCGAGVERGVFECMEMYDTSVLLFDYGLPAVNQTRFFIVDTHALQHAELHGRWNNHFHLVRLCLILDKKIKWNYELSPKLSDFLTEYKKSHSDEIILPPPRLERGKITTVDVLLVQNSDEYDLLVNQWAVQVYNAYHMYHKLVTGIADNFLEFCRDQKTLK